MNGDKKVGDNSEDNKPEIAFGHGATVSRLGTYRAIADCY